MEDAAAHASAPESAQSQSFERLAADLAAGFLNLPPERVDERIESGLGRVCRSLDLDLATVLQWRDPQKSSLTITHEWNGGATTTTFLGVTLVDRYAWLGRRLSDGTPLLISSLEDFPAEASEERATCERSGIRSVAWVPFRTEQGLEGHVAVNTVGRERRWPGDTVQHLRLIGQIFAQAIERRHADLRLRDAYAELDALKERLRKENESLRSTVAEFVGDDELIGRSLALRQVQHQVSQVAPTDSNVLVLGETGTGKGLVARSIHARSKRGDGPFVTVSCAALPEPLLESELFGHVKGAFTGAVNQKIGRFEAADGGTLFLDEIGELPQHLQAKLLRALEDRAFERVGSSETIQVDTRVVAATNRDLEAMIAEGSFRADLYFRLGVFPIHMPPLRERRGDVPLLVWYFIAVLGDRLGKKIDRVSEAEMRALEAYAWPGNVRELQNVVERAMILSRGPQLELPPMLAQRPTRIGSRATARGLASDDLEEVERAHIVRVLKACGWRIRGEGGAAERLGLKRTTLQSRMKKLGIVRPTR